MSDKNLPVRRLKIAVLSRSFSTRGGGAERYSVAVATQLAQTHEVCVFAQNFDTPPPGITVHPVGPALRRPRWLNQLVYAWQTARLTRTGFDVVHSHENVWQADVQTFHVKSVRGSLLGPRRGWRRALAWLKVVTSPRKLTYLALETARCKPRPGRAQVAVSTLLADELRGHYPHTTFEIIAPGVDAPLHRMPRAQAQQHLGLASDKTWLLLVGNDFKRKGLDAALAALAQLPQHVHLAVAGDTRQQANYLPIAQQLGVAPRVQFLGSLRDMSVAYQAAHLLVHPTLEDSFGMVVLEAMAHGLPVVVSGPAYCGVAAQLVHGQQAWLLKDPHDAQELAGTIQSLLLNSELLEQYLPGLEGFLALNGWQQVAQHYERLYRQVTTHKMAHKSGVSPNNSLDTPPDAR